MQNPPPNYSEPGPGAGTGKSSTGLDANIAALIAYIFTFLSGLIFFLIEKESRYVRFHAMQALLLGAGFFILWIVLVIVNITLAFASGTLATLMGLISFLIWIGFLGVIILCCVKAYQGQWFKLPVIGDLAEKYAGK